MSLSSLDSILGSLPAQPQWQQTFHSLLKHWNEVVGSVVAANTRPVSLQRNVLYVGASSAVWVQELTLGRQRLLHKLNTYLSTPLTDIRFSTALWQHAQTLKPEAENSLNQHPSYLNHTATPTKSRNFQDPIAAFQQWAMVIQVRSQALPLCCQCNCPTPTGELQRWGVCAICMTKR